MRYYTNILLGKNSVRRPSCTLFRFRVVIMTTLEHAVEECRRILPLGKEGGREGGGGINFMFSCLLLKWLVW
jgi:hypothetical protein